MPSKNHPWILAITASLLYFFTLSLGHTNDRELLVFKFILIWQGLRITAPIFFSNYPTLPAVLKYRINLHEKAKTLLP